MHSLPQIPGAKKKGVLLLTSKEGLKKLDSFLINDTVCISGSVEAALNLGRSINEKYKVEVKVVTEGRSEEILPSGIEIMNSPIQEIVGEGRAEAVKFKDGKAVGACLVLFVEEKVNSYEQLSAGGNIMADLLIQLGTKGTDAVLNLTKEALKKQITAKGKDAAISFPETNYYFPLINALLNIEVKTLGDCENALTQAEGLSKNIPAKSGLNIAPLGGILNKGVATLISEEILAALLTADKAHPKGGIGFIPDNILRSLGLQLVDGRIAGIAVILGPAKDEDAAADLIRDFQSKSIVSLLAGNVSGNTMQKQLEKKGIEIGLDNYIVPLGEDYLSVIYAVNFAVRAPLIYGGFKPGQWAGIADYIRNRVPAFVLLLGHVDEVIVATGLGALAFGLPIITDLDVPQLGKIDTTLFEALVTEKDYKKLPSKCILTRGIKVKMSEVAIPLPYAAAFEGERVRKEQLYVEFGGKASSGLEFLTAKKEEEVDDGKIELIGPDIDKLNAGSKSMPLAVTVEVFGRKMQKDFEPILERQIHRFTNYAMGIMHMGQRDMIWIRFSKDAFNKGFRLKHIGVILHAMLHQEYSAIVDKVQIKLYTNQPDVDRLLLTAKKTFDERDERLLGMTDESVDTYYSCLLCQSFAPNHICIITPERLGLCGAYSWLDGKASYEITPTGPNQPIKKGPVLDERLGQWENINTFVKEKSNKTIEKVSMYSLMDGPQSSCVTADTQVIIDSEVINAGEFIDKHRGGEGYAKSAALTLNKGKAISEKIVAMQRFELPRARKKLIKIETKSGNKLTLTPNHEIAVDRPDGMNWIPAGAIKKGDRIISLKNLEVRENIPKLRSLIPDNFPAKDKKAFKQSVINKNLFYLMGLIASDGSVFRRGNFEYNIDFINTRRELINGYKKLYKLIFPQKNLRILLKKPSERSFIDGRRIKSTKPCYVASSNNAIFGVLLDYFGICDGKKKDRTFKKLLNLPKPYISSLLTGLFDGDGSVRLRKYKGSCWDVAEAYLCAANRHQAYYLEWLLKRFGILCNIRKSGSIYKVEMHGSNLDKFARIVSPVHRRKAKIIKDIRALAAKGSMDKTQGQVLPFFAGKLLAKLPESKELLSPTTRFYYETSRSRPVSGNLRKVLDKSTSREAAMLHSLLNSDFYLDIVTEAEKTAGGGKFVYNFTLSDTHCYFANQLLIKNCGCFECIIAIIPEANGVMIVNRDYTGMTPSGMTFTTLAGSVGGGVQTPGFLGVGKLYLLSKKFIAAEGGLKRLVWMPKELKELLGDRLVNRAKEIGEPDLIDKIADETMATTTDELLRHLEKTGHPALAMEPLI